MALVAERTATAWCRPTRRQRSACCVTVSKPPERPDPAIYITTCGKTILYGGDQHARVYWFVDHSALHGHSMAPASQQWRHDDPDDNLPPDTCRELCPDAFTGPEPPPPG